MAAKKRSTKDKRISYGTDYDDIPTSVRAEVKRMVEGFRTTPQICYEILVERRREEVIKANNEYQKEKRLEALLRSEVLYNRREGLGEAVNHLDGLAELLEHKLDADGRDNALQCGIVILREQIQKVQDMLNDLFSPPPEKVEEAEVAHG